LLRPGQVSSRSCASSLSDLVNLRRGGAMYFPTSEWEPLVCYKESFSPFFLLNPPYPCIFCHVYLPHHSRLASLNFSRCTIMRYHADVDRSGFIEMIALFFIHLNLPKCRYHRSSPCHFRSRSTVTCPGHFLVRAPPQ
jgi:hypothetical protein